MRMTAVMAALSFTGGALPAPPGAPVNHIEPGIGASGDGTFVIAGNAGGGRGADLWTSTDGGLTYRWSADPFNAPPYGSNPLNGQDSDATAAPAAQGSSAPNLYAVSLYSADTALTVSRDGGKTWQVNELGGMPSQDRPWVAADGPCTVFVAYQNGDSGPPSREMVSRFDACGAAPTLNGEAAILDPVQSPTDPYPLGSFLAGKPAVDNSPTSQFRHRLYIPSGGCETDMPGVTYVPSTDPFDCQFARASLSIAVSSDGGQSFAVHRVADSTTHELQVWADQLAIDSAGEIYLVWGDNRHVYLNTSVDGGTTWSKPSLVDRPPALSTALPTVAAGSPGHVDIAWYGSERAGASNDLKVMGAPGDKDAAQWRVYFAKSTDDGRTFAQTAVSGPVHTGILCTSANACTTHGSRGLFDDFGIAISPTTQRASIAYTIDNLSLAPYLPAPSVDQIGYATELPEPAAKPCRLRSRLRLPVPRPAHGRVVRVVVYVNGRRVLTRRGHDIRRVTFRVPKRRTLSIRILSTRRDGTHGVTATTRKACSA